MQHLSGRRCVVTLKAIFETPTASISSWSSAAGGRLLDEVARGDDRLSEHHASNLIRELMSVIMYCHEMGAVHRDVKPENVLLTKAGRLKLADFGFVVRVSNGLSTVSKWFYLVVQSGCHHQKVDVVPLEFWMFADYFDRI